MNKYNAKKTIVDGIKFDSKRESEVYKKLKEQNIKFERQVEYILQDGYVSSDGRKIRPIKYIADFVLMDDNNVITNVIDVKSPATITPEFKLKKKLFDKKYYPLYIEIWTE